MTDQIIKLKKKSSLKYLVLEYDTVLIEGSDL